MQRNWRLFTGILSLDGIKSGNFSRYKLGPTNITVLNKLRSCSRISALGSKVIVHVAYLAVSRERCVFHVDWRLHVEFVDVHEERGFRLMWTHVDRGRGSKT